jgi:hypothetical protein
VGAVTYLDISPREVVFCVDEFLKIHIRRQCHLACVDLEYFAFGLDVWQRELDLAINAPWDPLCENRSESPSSQKKNHKKKSTKYKCHIPSTWPNQCWV